MNQDTLRGRAEPARPAPCTDSEVFDDLARAVAIGRLKANAALEAIGAARRQFEEAIRPLLEQKDTALAELAAVEEELQRATLAAYRTRGARRPHPAASVRVRAQLVYDCEAMKAYAREHLPQVLLLDTRALERVAATFPVPGVQQVEEPVVVIAQDLRRYLPDELWPGTAHHTPSSQSLTFLAAGLQ
ncbi:MAG TPA: hypothetical protein VM536_19510 [Chloroflexia bacterium]|nr:hypothetical protein [Chloroflexia bacterium]